MDLTAGRFFALYREGAPWLQDALFDFVQCIESLPMQHGDQLAMAQQFPGEMVFYDVTVLDQHRRLPFQKLIEPPMPEQEAHYQIIQCQQSEGADQSAGERVVIANDGI